MSTFLIGLNLFRAWPHSAKNDKWSEKYKVEFCPKVKFKPFMTDATTKGDNLEFTTPSVEATILESNGGIWEKHGVYNSEMAAINALNAMFGQSLVL